VLQPEPQRDRAFSEKPGALRCLSVPSVIIGIIFEQNPFRRSDEIVVLTIAERPQEGG
jgi:hypothetical protein